jgi:hypothetical protein
MAWIDASAAALEARGDARSLATAAFLLGAAPSTPDIAARALKLAERAADADSQDHTFGWLRLRLCEQAPGCDVRETAASMRWLDPDNAAAWLSSLAHAATGHDEQATEHALAGMAQGSRLRYYWNPAIVMALDALQAAGLPADRHAASPHARLEQLLALASLVLVPNPKPLFDACAASPQPPQPMPAQATLPQHHETCMKIAVLMQHADTVAAQRAGYSLQRRMAAADSAEARNAAERSRALENRVRREAQAETAFLPWFRNRIAVHRIELMRRHEREEDCIIAVLRERHLEI